MKFSQPALLLSLNLVVAINLFSTFTHALPAHPSKPTSLESPLSQRQQQQQHRSHHYVREARSAKAHAENKSNNSKNNRSNKSNSKLSTGPSPTASSKIKRADKITSSVIATSKYAGEEPPLLLLPDSNSVWHAGSIESVKWSKKYARRLPKDTTVDIILVDSKSNKKLFSLKRFIPFRKGSAQVWVPSKISEDGSYVLVLELYHGRSQKPATIESKAQEPSIISESTTIASFTSTATTTTKASQTSTGGTITEPNNDNGIPSILRRSDISIARRSRRVERDIMTSSYSSSSSSPSSTTSSSSSSSHLDINNEDYYKGHKEDQPFEFSPDEFRQEYPNVAQPIELEHTFGLHQKVYTLTPYTLEWKVPSRVVELLEYTQARLRLMTDKAIDQRNNPALHNNDKTFVAKVLAELVQDQTLVPVSVLARNIPAETRFQYLQIHDRVPPAFYRLKVQMVVVEVQGGQGRDADASGSRSTRLNHSKYMEGWDFPNGGQVVDRYETITRRFWVSGGAL
ncbi:hypothetical protein BX616_008947 [Lobosporangium transversale]|uniref:Uncharacterized protein n=1 Tax=Lobosporangium transversale TaxID=64571 RepID=A0A1Y2GZ81_9FUNG|nr:hypothetical protein BCR41DRAFT_345556 [Lobosporangium transversale]KAF9914106.1 hypothetical protein BX616_008947 [Lobosporangium transversale]ORZ27585.1 hypothetical protein BCR41DRAFT_345556 [Lobosporangium transversale]|eukprot:XP_021885288.1 hypothetical protein BCR41DRAFT_345556 [Lobosporangium transversale]